MKMLLYRPTLSMVAEAAALTAAYRLPRHDQKALETRSGTIWKKAEKVDNKFEMTKDHIIPWYSLDKPYYVIIPTREEWEKDWPDQLRKGQA